MKQPQRFVIYVPLVFFTILLFTIISFPALAGHVTRLTVGTTMQVKTININDYYFGILRSILTHKGLVRLDETGDFTGDLAASWTTSDAVNWTFKIAQNLTWHDGRAVRAGDVKFTIEYLLKKIPVYQHHFKLIQTVTAPDDHTLIIRLSEANPRFLINLLVLRTLPEHIFKTVDDPRTFQSAQAAIGCGPFIFTDFDPSAGTLRFKAYTAYHKGPPNVSEVIFRMFKNPDTLYMALKKGEIDMPWFYAGGSEPHHATSLKNRKDIVIHQIPNLGLPGILFFNTAKAPLDTVEIRKAISLAVDYKEMVRYFGGGFGKIPNAGIVPKGALHYIETPAMTHDPARARQILTDLGYSDINGDGIMEKKGKPLTIEIIIRTDVSNNSRIVELLKKRLAGIGIGLAVKAVDYNRFRQISDKERSHAMLLSRTTPWGMMMWAGMGAGYFDARNIGWANLSDPHFTQIIDQMNAAVSNKTYRDLAADLQRYYANNLPAIPLFWNDLLQPVKKSLSGFKISPMYGFLWEETWFNLKEASH